MKPLIVAIHGILTGQTQASWPDRFDAWMLSRDPEVHVLKKEYWAGPFPRWNCFVKDRLLASSLANEVELFLSQTWSGNSGPPIWFLAHSNGAVIALQVTEKLIARGYSIGGLILTGAACEADVEKNGILSWIWQSKLGAALAYSSKGDQVVAGIPANAPTRASRLTAWFWTRLISPYGGLGRSGWTWQGQPFESSELNIYTRWFPGGHSGYFQPDRMEQTFEQVYEDVTTVDSSRREETQISPKKENQSQVTSASTNGILVPSVISPLAFSLQPLALAQIPTLPGGALETWIFCAMAILSGVALVYQVFGRKTPEAEFVSKAEFRLFRESVERELTGLRDRIDARFLSVIEKLEQLKGELLVDSERSSGSGQGSVNELEAGLARVDERTRKER